MIFTQFAGRACALAVILLPLLASSAEPSQAPERPPCDPAPAASAAAPAPGVPAAEAPAAVPAVAQAAAAAPAAPEAEPAAEEGEGPEAQSGPMALMPLTTVPPEIPDAACQRRASGWVKLEYAVLPNGKVANVKVTDSRPKGVFDDAAANAVAQWTYPPQKEPVVLHQTLPLSFSDCRIEQLKVEIPETVDAESQADCVAIAQEAMRVGERFGPADSGRAVLRDVNAQVYSAPAEHCVIPGKTIKSGTRLTAHIAHNRFSFVSRGSKGDELQAVWVRSRQLKDVMQ